jgi:hypothetical protein
VDPIKLTVKIENQEIQGSGDRIKIKSGYPIMQWSFDPITSVVINSDNGVITDTDIVGQLGYEIRITSSLILEGTWGESSFVGNKVSTSFVYSKDNFWNYAGNPLERGKVYYGQIQVKDENNRSSGWFIFSFEYDAVPLVEGVRISPNIPSVTDDLILTYDYHGDTEQGTVIRWFKNGVYQKQFDNSYKVENGFLQVDDIWSVDVVPFDGYAYGVRVTSPSVRVSQTSPIASTVEISPDDPNENDILKAKYSYVDPVINDNPDIRWFINSQLISDYNDQKFIRPNVDPGDKVKYEIRPKGGTIYYSSLEKTIGYSDFIIYDIMIDGKIDPLQVSTISPTVSWKVHIPLDKDVNYISIKIGTFYGSDNIYSVVLQSDKETFNVPINILSKGVDYYISISVSDTQVFNKFCSSHFRILGSRWQESADNDTGWTIESLFTIGNAESFPTSPVFNESDYQIIRINDGSRFGEIRIYHQKIGFISQNFVTSSIIDTTGFNILTIVGHGDDVKIYFNRSLIIDGTGLFTQESDIQSLEIGNPTGKDFTLSYKYFYYTTSGSFYPGISEEYSNIKFQEYMKFEDNEVLSLRGYTKDYQDYKLFGVNPDDEEESTSMYSLIPGKSQFNSTVNRTFSPINNIRTSPDKNKIAVAHSKGATIITGYQISNFDSEIDFYNLELDSNGDPIYTFPDKYGWTLVQNIGVDSVYFDSSGFNINTITSE